MAVEWGTIRGVTEAWQEALRHGGFEAHVRSPEDLRRIGRLSRVHRQILRVTGVRPPARVLEIGVGGGKQLVPFALRGFRCHGIDTSPEAIDRLQTLTAEIRQLQPIDLTGAAQTFPADGPGEGYDLVFHSGVIHQILDPTQRAAFHQAAARVSTGHVVVIVSSSLVGRHDSSGYVAGDTVLDLTAADMPVVRYTPQLVADELRIAGLRQVRVLPVNVGGQWPRPVRLPLQALPRVQPLNRWSAALMGVGHA
jgi:SAM-dependent methyltransferase